MDGKREAKEYKHSATHDDDDDDDVKLTTLFIIRE